MSVLGIIVLLFQAILLAHGGLTTLGANTFSMAIFGPFVSYGLFRLLKKTGYQGAVILEPYAAQTRDDARLRASLSYLRQAMREAGV